MVTGSNPGHHTGTGLAFHINIGLFDPVGFVGRVQVKTPTLIEFRPEDWGPTPDAGSVDTTTDSFPWWSLCTTETVKLEQYYLPYAEHVNRDHRVCRLRNKPIFSPIIYADVSVLIGTRSRK
jgi:hypothetical protein